MEGAIRSTMAIFCMCRELTTLAERDIVLDMARFHNSNNRKGQYVVRNN
jgi:hypothetical protein